MDNRPMPEGLSNDDKAALEAGRNLEPNAGDFGDAYYLLGRLIKAGFVEDPLKMKSVAGWHSSFEVLVWETAEIIHQIKSW